MGNIGNGGIRLGGVVHFELHQDAAHIPLITGQGPVEQQGPLGLVELQQAGKCVDVFLDEGGLLFQSAVQPFARNGQHGYQVFRLVLDIFIQEEKQRRFIVGAAPDSVPLQKFRG